jgi:hypothetical protein
VVLGDTGFAINDRPLQLSGTADRVDDARELYQYPVARPLDDAAGMLADLRVDELAAMRLEALVRSFLVRAHQTRVARHIGGEDRGKTAGRGHGCGGPPCSGLSLGHDILEFDIVEFSHRDNLSSASLRLKRREGVDSERWSGTSREPEFR